MHVYSLVNHSISYVMLLKIVEQCLRCRLPSLYYHIQQTAFIYIVFYNELVVVVLLFFLASFFFFFSLFLFAVSVYVYVYVYVFMYFDVGAVTNVLM